MRDGCHSGRLTTAGGAVIFLASAVGLLVKTESGGDSTLSQCYSVWTPLQPTFHGLQLLSATRAFWTAQTPGLPAVIVPRAIEGGPR